MKLLFTSNTGVYAKGGAVNKLDTNYKQDGNLKAIFLMIGLNQDFLKLKPIFLEEKNYIEFINVQFVPSIYMFYFNTNKKRAKKDIQNIFDILNENDVKEFEIGEINKFSKK